MEEVAPITQTRVQYWGGPRPREETNEPLSSRRQAG